MTIMVKDARKPEERYMLHDGVSIDLGSTWKRRKDDVAVEVVWMGDWREPRIQLRRYGATNLKNTHWISPENLLRLYDGWCPVVTTETRPEP